jgi:hypothetical protein
MLSQVEKERRINEGKFRIVQTAKEKIKKTLLKTSLGESFYTQIDEAFVFEDKYMIKELLELAKSAFVTA